MGSEPEVRAHLEWLGFVQPIGLVVSPPALVAAQAYVDRNCGPLHTSFLRHVRRETGPDGRESARIEDLPAFFTSILRWEATDLAGGPGGPPLPDGLIARLADFEETLVPTYAVLDPQAPPVAPPAILLVQSVAPDGADLDTEPADGGQGFAASPEARFERLLRETKVPIGLLCNGTALRLVYAPAGESSGHVTFPVAAMAEVGGRPIFAALHLLLNAERLFVVARDRRLPRILSESRRYQNDVSTRLAEQVLAALYELVRGFQAADDAARGDLLRDYLADPAGRSEVYGGLVTTLLRMVFVLYAEDRGLLPGDEVFGRSYSLGGLFARLRDDDARHHDTMDQRHGAWPRLLTLFRVIHDGAAHGALRLPARKGELFDPDRYPFLEGRPRRSRRVPGERADPPRVPDGVVWRVLERLLILDGERLSYRALDVEQIGSVYEALMGFEVQRAAGASIAIRPDHVVVDLEALLAQPGPARARGLLDDAGTKLTGAAAEALRGAVSVDGLLAALEKRISKERTPGAIPKSGMYLQPTPERRRSGSHYTPRSLTRPIVETTFRPILANLGARPRPEAILALKVCDPAMGSGAFLVESCRFLAERLVEAWQRHAAMPRLPADEEPLLHAKRLIAQRCLYGVDKNPFAVQLAKLSLWLATLAKDHPFTFLDHALREGDSLVGLTREQIANFHWGKASQLELIRGALEAPIEDAERLRAQIHALAESDDGERKSRLLTEADARMERVRLVGDAVIAAFFGAENEKAREVLRGALC